MSKVMLGIGLACLMITPAYADGFEMPWLPDFWFAFPPAVSAVPDAGLKTSGISTARLLSGKTQAVAGPQRRKSTAAEAAQQ